jgi:hypothetical protein
VGIRVQYLDTGEGTLTMPRVSVWILRVALIYLGVGFTFGAYMLANKGLNFDPGAWRLLFPHMELLLVGWTTQLIVGVAFWIMPRFSGSEKYGKVRLVWVSHALLNAGILTVVAGGWIGSNELILAGRAAELLAAVLFAIYIAPRVKPLGGQAAAQADQTE